MLGLDDESVVPDAALEDQETALVREPLLRGPAVGEQIVVRHGVREDAVGVVHSLSREASLLWFVPAAAATFEVSPGDDVAAAVAGLAPGDELVVHGGDYPLGSRFGIEVVGTSLAPIVIRAADGEQPHFSRAAPDQNVWDVDRAEYLTIRGIELSGGSAGLRIASALHLTVEDCDIHDTGDVGLRANDGGQTYDGLQILHNEIHHTGGTGEGMYLGCNEDACRVANSLVAGNLVHDTNGPTVVQGDGIELKEGSHDNVVRDNVVYDTHYPCILAYATNGNGGPNVVERNVMWGCGDHGIQVAADAVLRNNVVLGSAADGIAMQPHQSGAPSGLVVVHNTVLHATGDAVSLRGVTGDVVVANNALYAQPGAALIVVAGDARDSSSPERRRRGLARRRPRGG